MPDDPHMALGAFLSAGEAETLAARLQARQHLSKALGAISPGRRVEARRLLVASGVDHTNIPNAVGVLNAVAGAKSVHRDLTPVWTMPGNEATIGHLTSEFHRLVSAARVSVTCATYNFQTTSQMWTALHEAARQPGVVVTVYVDGDKAEATKVAEQLPSATIYQSAELPAGRRVVSHAKFIIIDHELLLLTSANFSYSAENRNVEFGLLVHNPELARSIETTMASKHGVLYDLV